MRRSSLKERFECDEEFGHIKEVMDRVRAEDAGDIAHYVAENARLRNMIDYLIEYIKNN